MTHRDDDFWDDFLLGQQSKTASSLDAYLSAREDELANSGLRSLTDKGRAANAFHLPADAGTRVSFMTNIGSVLSYADPPAPNAEGTIVMVRTAEGDQTGMGGMLFVKFDDGRFMAMHPEHLRAASPNRKVARGFVRRVASLGDLTGFLHWGSDDNELVHKATRDLWRCETGQNGDFVIARLFDDTGEPLKI